jgi:hypothetical protein
MDYIANIHNPSGIVAQNLRDPFLCKSTQRPNIPVVRISAFDGQNFAVDNDSGGLPLG